METPRDPGSPEDGKKELVAIKKVAVATAVLAILCGGMYYSGMWSWLIPAPLADELTR